MRRRAVNQILFSSEVHYLGLHPSMSKDNVYKKCINNLKN
jgi:hypothetical protein